jgi:hypothetical protein
MKNIKVKKDKKGNCYLDLEDFADIVDISKVKKYTLETTMDGDTHEQCLILKFYDKKGNVVEADEKV